MPTIAIKHRPYQPNRSYHCAPLIKRLQRMSFWKRLISFKNDRHKAESYFEKYRKELNELNLKTISDLEHLVKPLIRIATKIEVSPDSKPPKNSQLNSHFGGQPYFEEEEIWPINKDGTHLDFIFQVFNSSELQLPKSIELIQFYYDWNQFAWDTSSDGWFLKIYRKIEKEKIIHIDKPDELERSNYCNITYEPTKSLPDWDGIYSHFKNVMKLSCVLDESKPWGSYNKVATKLIGEQKYQSQLGGYPKWMQLESTPKNIDGNPMKLLFQIDSEVNAGLLWGESKSGLIYVFYDEKTEKIEFILQCH